ncbi:MAG: IS21 family transposase [Deltaproteobacteria bacterium]|nr:IS21 family transposase [Deltaproteobacteria bacterium]
MAYRELTVADIAEILRRWLRGDPLREIGRSCRVDRKTVRRYVAAAQLEGLSVGAAHGVLTEEVVLRVGSRVHVGAPVQVGASWSVCAAHADQLLKWHAEGAAGPKLVKLLARHTGVEVVRRTLQRFMKAELAGRKKPHSTQYVATCGPGKELQVDYETLGRVYDADAERDRVLHAFVCTSVYSRHAFVYPCWDETTETTIEALEAAWRFFGGVFAGIVPDNLKAIVIKADEVSPVFNQEFVEYATARNFDIGPARVRKPQDKGRVENNVKYTQGDLFACETFTTISQWRAEAERWCRQDAGLRVHGTTFRRPLEHFEQEERSALLPMPTSAWDVGRWVDAKVGRDRRIRVANAWYRLDGADIGDTVRVRVGRTTLRVLSDRELLGAFPRVEAGQTGGAARDLTSLSDATAGRSREAFLAAATLHGGHVAQVVDRVLSQGMWFNQVRKAKHLLELCERYGGQVADDACAKLLAVDDADVTRVARVIQLGLDQRPPLAAGLAMPPPGPQPPPRFGRDPSTWQRMCVPASAGDPNHAT